MGKKLVIVESPAKAKTINKILGKDFIVKSSIGHVRDLPPSKIGVDFENSFKPEYVVIKGKIKVVSELKKAVKECDIIYLAPDPDREGEAIAWHLKELLDNKKDHKKFYRIQYNEVTPRAVQEAFEHPGEIDLNRVNAQQARRILDRIVGYTVSPMLWRRVRRGLSAGRVQSVALRLVCEREAEIKKFVPEEYWLFGAEVCKLVEPTAPFMIRLLRIDNKKADLKNALSTEALKTDLEGRVFKVKDITIRDIKKNPVPPFITSTLQQSCASYLGFAPYRTMGIAQKLYEGLDLGEGAVGLITYMRTDSFTIAQDALNDCRNFIEKQYGKEYLPEKPNFYKNRGSAQAAHEAIRPTDVNRTPESISHKLDPSLWKVYKLIWQRFVSSQTAQAKIEHRTVKIEALPKDSRITEYLFQAASSEVKFPGYMKVSGFDMLKKKEEDQADEVEFIPPLNIGEELKRLEWIADRKETKPLPHFSESALIKTLEKDGVGRPSTYAQIISTLRWREYVKKDEKPLIPTEIGMKVSQLLVETLEKLFNVEFTALMEESLDEIENGHVEWTSMLGKFYSQFTEWMKGTVLPPADVGMVDKMLTVLERITEWKPPVKTGKRKVYSDEKYVKSVREQLIKGKKEVSQKQLFTLMKLGCIYKEHVPDIVTAITDIGHGELLNARETQPPPQSTVTKLELLKNIELEESTRDFVNSLHARVIGGRALTEAQLQALNNIVVKNACNINNFEDIRTNLEVEGSDVASDVESGPLTVAAAHITEWKDPVHRGKRIFDDKLFYASLSEQQKRKGFLSIKQREALKKIILRYAAQIPDFLELAEKYDIKKKPRKGKGEIEEPPPAE